MFRDPLPEAGLDLSATLDTLERRLVAEALKRCDGNVTAAARLLRLKRTTLAKKLSRQRMAA